VLSDLLAVVFPMVCPGCGRRGEPLCAACAGSLQAAPDAPVPRGVDAWVAPFAYAGVVREVVARVKYRDAHCAVTWLARAMAGAVEVTVREAGVDVVTWAPTTVARRRQRGFDHAELLARSVARGLSVPARSLLRREPGPPQTGLAAAARRRGPVFAAAGRTPRSVLLVDDVATTGATLAAAAAALRGAGAQRVVAVTAARTPPPGRARAIAASHQCAPVDTGEHRP
jgi:ComF family protein